MSSLDKSPEKDVEFWSRFIREKPINDLQTIKEAAKQLVTITSALQVLLLAVLPIKEIRPLISGWKVLLFMVPSFLWLIGLALSVSVLIPHTKPMDDFERFDDMRDLYEKIALRKVNQLKAAQVLLLIGLATLILASAAYFLFVPIPPPKP